MRILFSAHDPGGCNLLIPLINSLSDRADVSVFLAMAGPARKKVNMSNRTDVELVDIPSFPIPNFPNEYDVQEDEVANILDRIQPDILFTSTSINSNIERFIISYGKNAGIPTISYIDSWLGEDIRFSSEKISTLPDYILVCDPEMKGIYLKFEANNSKVLDVGNPHLEELAEAFQQRGEIDNYVADRVLFFSENIKHYYPDEQFNEIRIIESILSSYNYNRDLHIVIRPHPLESKDHWQSFIEKSNGVNKFIRLSLDECVSLSESVEGSSLTFGISSMALIEASIMGRFTFSFQVGVQGNRKFLYIPFDTYGISCISSIDEVCKELSMAGAQNTGYKGNYKISAVDKVINLLSEI
jgi:hypothetical protein